MTTAMFRTLTQCVGVDAPLAQRWWQAVCQARWSVPCSWRRDLAYFGVCPTFYTRRYWA